MFQWENKSLSYYSLPHEEDGGGQEMVTSSLSQHLGFYFTYFNYSWDHYEGTPYVK